MEHISCVTIFTQPGISHSSSVSIIWVARSRSCAEVVELNKPHIALYWLISRQCLQVSERFDTLNQGQGGGLSALKYGIIWNRFSRRRSHSPHIKGDARLREERCQQLTQRRAISSTKSRLNQPCCLTLHCLDRQKVHCQKLLDDFVPVDTEPRFKQPLVIDSFVGLVRQIDRSQKTRDIASDGSHSTVRTTLLSDRSSYFHLRPLTKFIMQL